MSKSVIFLNFLFLLYLSSYAVLPADASECYRYYAKYLDERLNLTVRSQQRCFSSHCWRAHVSFTDTPPEHDLIEGGCIDADNCDIIGENQCSYGDDIPDVKMNDARVFGRASYTNAKPKAVCCCTGNLCNSANPVKSAGVLTFFAISLLGRLLLNH